MAMPITRDSGRPACAELAAGGMSVSGLEQYKLDRLLELRAVIDALRADRTPVPWLDGLMGKGRTRS
jgi:hypothetical protein